jgi:hypothetical protein
MMLAGFDGIEKSCGVRRQKFVSSKFLFFAFEGVFLENLPYNTTQRKPTRYSTNQGAFNQVHLAAQSRWNQEKQLVEGVGPKSTQNQNSSKC